MMGDSRRPGIVVQALQQGFQAIEQAGAATHLQEQKQGIETDARAVAPGPGGDGLQALLLGFPVPLVHTQGRRQGQGGVQGHARTDASLPGRPVAAVDDVPPPAAPGHSQGIVLPGPEHLQGQVGKIQA